ncbi:MAG: Regulator of cell morphosis and signaling [Myxococcales bacterium]|nr:Regulator of cell morphosis and signaling [Myxococcales bacterium]
MDALELLRAQHSEIQQRLLRIRTQSAVERRRELDDLSDAVEMHLLVEERHLEPLLHELSFDAVALKVETARRLMARTVAELRAIDAADPRFDATLSVLWAELARHHDENEGRLFPALAGSLSQPLLRALGQSMLETIAEAENDNWIGAAQPDTSW